MAACHPIRVVFRGNCPCVREGPCRTPVAPRRRLTSGGGMRRASGTGLRVSQVSFAPEKRRTCTRPLSGGRTPRGPLRAASPCLRHLPSEAALLRRICLPRRAEVSRPHTARLHAQDGLAEYRLRPLHANPLVCGRATPAYLGRLVSRLPKGLRDQGRPLVRLWAGL